MLGEIEALKGQVRNLLKFPTQPRRISQIGSEREAVQGLLLVLHLRVMLLLCSKCVLNVVDEFYVCLSVLMFVHALLLCFKVCLLLLRFFNVFLLSLNVLFEFVFRPRGFAKFFQQFPY